MFIAVSHPHTATGYVGVFKSSNTSKKRPYRVLYKGTNPLPGKYFESAEEASLAFASYLGVDENLRMARIYGMIPYNDPIEEMVDDLTRSDRITSRTHKIIDDTPTHRMCTKCNAWVLLSDFCVNRNKTQRTCKSCNSKMSRMTNTTWRGKVGQMYRNMKNTTNKRNEKGRKHDPPEWSNLNEFYEWIARVLSEKRLRCAISDRILSPSTISIERKDESLGYSPENCILIDEIFQSRGGVYQWTRERYQSLLQHAEAEYCFNEQDALDALACDEEFRKHGGYRPVVYSKHADEDEWKKHTDSREAAAYRNVTVGCVRDRAYNEYATTSDGIHFRYDKKRKRLHPPPLYVFFQTLFHSTVQTTKKRNNRGRDMSHDFSIRNFIELWQTQKGRCAYTGIPMATTANTPCKCSPERCKNNVGYVQGNVIFVITECNSRAKWNL